MDDYRHQPKPIYYTFQASVAHAFQLLHRKGIPKKKLITMMPNDVVKSYHNPRRGKLVNNLNCTDYYRGMNVDYQKKDVTPDMVENILKNVTVPKKLKMKLLGSGPADNVFIYLVGQGTEDFITFPDSKLSGVRLENLLKNLSDGNRYNKMLIFADVCEAEPMIAKAVEGLRNVILMASSRKTNCSTEIFFDKKIGVHVADEFSHHWMTIIEESMKDDSLVEFFSKSGADRNRRSLRDEEEEEEEQDEEDDKGCKEKGKEVQIVIPYQPYIANRNQYMNYPPYAAKNPYFPGTYGEQQKYLFN
ncbi:unnamed protein product [Calicophoron daubneyi]|uniref:Legumain n=1 Tax=Calicophoron daubneyi TaxID=300641 RepID=A0AAV2TR61_CALDB